MTAIAAARAAAAGLDNVAARSLDLEQIAEPDGTYDVVLCREGLMFAAEPGRAAAEIARVLRPGGRAAIAVWGPRAANPWLGLVFDAVSEQLGMPMPPPGLPGPFALGDAERLRRLLVDGGLVDVDVRELDVPLAAPSFEDWWTRTSSLAGPLSALLAGMAPEATADLAARLTHGGGALRDAGRAALPWAGPPGLRSDRPLSSAGRARAGVASRPAEGS